MDAQQSTVGGIEAHGNPNGQLDGPGATSAAPGMAAGARTVLIVLAAARFPMTLDRSVTNVSIVYVADDLITTLATRTSCFAGRMTSLEGRGGPRGGAWLSRATWRVAATDMAAIRSQSVG